MELRKNKFDFDKLLNDVITNTQYTIDSHIIIKEGETKRQVFADEYRLAQVFTNLLDNAIKYSPKADKIIVSVSSDQSNVFVAVQDFGIGIAEEDQKNIFAPFFRTDISKNRGIAGLGLGLHIAAEIIKRHGGNMWVESKKGKGSKFIFSIPATNREKK